MRASEDEVIEIVILDPFIHIMLDSEFHYVAVNNALFNQRNYCRASEARNFDIRGKCLQALAVYIRADRRFGRDDADFLASISYDLFDCWLDNTEDRNIRISPAQRVQSHSCSSVASDNDHLAVIFYKIVNYLSCELSYCIRRL